MPTSAGSTGTAPPVDTPNRDAVVQVVSADQVLVKRAGVSSSIKPVVCPGVCTRAAYTQRPELLAYDATSPAPGALGGPGRPESFCMAHFLALQLTPRASLLCCSARTAQRATSVALGE